MASVSHSSAFPFIKFPLLRSDEINRDLYMFTDQLLPQKLPSLVGIVSLPRIGLPERRVKMNRSPEISGRQR